MDTDNFMFTFQFPEINLKFKLSGPRIIRTNHINHEKLTSLHSSGEGFPHQSQTSNKTVMKINRVIVSLSEISSPT